MKARMLFWIGSSPNDLPMKDVLSFIEYSEDIFEEASEMIKNSVAAGVAEVVDNIDFG